MNISRVIEQFGYKPNEVKVYLASLAVVEATASEIAAKAKLPLSSAEVAIKKLHKDGLMNFYSRKSRKYWIAEPPEHMVQLLKEKEEHLALALKDLHLIGRKTNGKPKVEVYEGEDEIKLLQHSMIQKKYPISAIIPWEAWANLLSRDYLNDFIRHRASHFLNIRMLVSKTPDTLKLKSRDLKELRHTKFLPGNMTIEDPLFIFGDTVAIITLNERQPTGVAIEDPATTRMMTTFFEDIWGRASE